MAEIRSSYIICTTPRSGSWMLCSILRQTNIAGWPTEFFGPTLNEEFLSNRNLLHLTRIEEYVERANAYSTRNGVFGMKLLANQGRVFVRRAVEHQGRPILSLRDALESEYPDTRYIWLRRRNTVAQSISYYRALMTQVWIHPARVLDVSTRPVPYDPFAIQRCYQDISSLDAYWQGFFEKHSISPLELWYEELLNDRVSIVQHLLRYLELPADIAIPEPATTKMADEESLEWEERFRSGSNLPPKEMMDLETLWGPY